MRTSRAAATRGRPTFEEFIRADVPGRDDVVAWQEDHRRNSPYPLRHIGTNVHLTAERPGEADFRSYLFVHPDRRWRGEQPRRPAIVAGHRAHEGGALRFADLRVVLDFTDSVTFSDATLHEPA